MLTKLSSMERLVSDLGKGIHSGFFLQLNTDFRNSLRDALLV